MSARSPRAGELTFTGLLCRRRPLVHRLLYILDKLRHGGDFTLDGRSYGRWNKPSLRSRVTVRRGRRRKLIEALDPRTPGITFRQHLGERLETVFATGVQAAVLKECLDRLLRTLLDVIARHARRDCEHRVRRTKVLISQIEQCSDALRIRHRSIRHDPGPLEERHRHPARLHAKPQMCMGPHRNAIRVLPRADTPHRNRAARRSRREGRSRYLRDWCHALGCRTG
jgi:hypothetical protein